MTRTPRMPVVALLLATAAVAAGCSSTPVVDRADVEDKVSQQLEKQVGQAPDDVSCPGDLKGEVGEKMRCTLTAGKDELGVTVTVRSVDGEQVNFDFQVDEMDQGEGGGA